MELVMTSVQSCCPEAVQHLSFFPLPQTASSSNSPLAVGSLSGKRLLITPPALWQGLGLQGPLRPVETEGRR